MKLRKYTESQLREAVKTSTSLRGTLMKLSVSPYGGNYQVLKRAINYFEIDTSHFTGQRWSEGKSFGPRKTLEEQLIASPTNSHRLRLRLLSEGVFQHRCANCLLECWLQNPIPLELDHINGDNSDNRIDNLRLLCPNCHSLTSTYRGRNITKKFRSVLPD